MLEVFQALSFGALSLRAGIQSMGMLLGQKAGSATLQATMESCGLSAASKASGSMVLNEAMTKVAMTDTTRDVVLVGGAAVGTGAVLIGAPWLANKGSKLIGGKAVLPELHLVGAKELRQHDANKGHSSKELADRKLAAELKATEITERYAEMLEKHVVAAEQERATALAADVVAAAEATKAADAAHNDNPLRCQ